VEERVSTRDPEEGGGSSAFPFSPQDALAFMQKMWNPLGVPIPGFGMPQAAGAPEGAAATPGAFPGGMPFPNPAMMFAALDPAEVERKIGELRVIQGWLAMSLSMMQMSIKTLELQKASLEAFRAAQSPQSPPKRSSPADGKRKA
jgi:hypothetical protein